MKTFVNISKEKIADVIDEVAQYLKPGCLVFLEGEPGTGKTFFVSQLLWRFDISEVASPTFALHHQYLTKNVLFHHYDLYRVESVDELETVGLWDFMNQDRQGIFLIEWASKLPADIWPLETPQIKIFISEYSPESRNYQISVAAR